MPTTSKQPDQLCQQNRRFRNSTPTSSGLKTLPNKHNALLLTSQWREITQEERYATSAYLFDIKSQNVALNKSYVLPK